MTLQLYLNTVALLFVLSFNVFRKMDNHSAKIVVCWKVAACDSGPESESAKFYRLQLWLQLWSKRSTPTNSNSGLDSDPAALILTISGGYAIWNHIDPGSMDLVNIRKKEGHFQFGSRKFPENGQRFPENSSKFQKMAKEFQKMAKKAKNVNKNREVAQKGQQHFWSCKKWWKKIKVT